MQNIRKSIVNQSNQPEPKWSKNLAWAGYGLTIFFLATFCLLFPVLDFDGLFDTFNGFHSFAISGLPTFPIFIPCLIAGILGQLLFVLSLILTNKLSHTHLRTVLYLAGSSLGGVLLSLAGSIVIFSTFSYDETAMTLLIYNSIIILAVILFPLLIISGKTKTLAPIIICCILAIFEALFFSSILLQAITTTQMHEEDTHIYELEASLPISPR